MDIGWSLLILPIMLNCILMILGKEMMMQKYGKL